LNLSSSSCGAADVMLKNVHPVRTERTFFTSHFTLKSQAKKQNRKQKQKPLFSVGFSWILDFFSTVFWAKKQNRNHSIPKILRFRTISSTVKKQRIFCM
jgi:hypothetical protein